MNSTLPSNQDCRSKLLPVNCFILLPGGTSTYHVKFLNLYHKQQHTWLLSVLPFLVLKSYSSKFYYFCSITEITANPNLILCIFTVKGNMGSSKTEVTDLPPDTTPNVPSVYIVGILKARTDKQNIW